MKFKFILMIFLILFGCASEQKIFINGKPVISNITYSSNPATGISSTSLFIVKSEKYEGDEKYESSNFYSLVTNHEFKKSNITSILYSLSINNTLYFKKYGNGFYYKLYKVMKVINHKNRTLNNQVNLVYSGHLSFKEFVFNLPKERGDEVSCYFEVRNKKEDIIFKTLEVNYKII